MIGSFLTPLHIEFLDGRTYRLLQGFSYTTEIGKLGVILVPSGFITDFASVPRFFWRLFPPTGEYGKAAVIHDYLYRCCPTVPRKDCDDVFLEGMACLGVNVVTRNLMYRAVRVFGGVARRCELDDEKAG